MAHGTQDSSLHGVASTEGLRVAGFPCEPVSLGGTTARSRRELAHADGSEEVDGERNPVLRIGETKCVRGRQEEEVEGQHAHERDGDRPAKTPQSGNGQHGEEVDHAEAEDRRDRAQGVDRPGHECDSHQAEESCSDAHRSLYKSTPGNIRARQRA